MCGKFKAYQRWRELRRYREVSIQAGDEAVLATPMRVVPIVCLDQNDERTVVPMRWGWVDPKAPDPLKKPGMMHARGETADEKPMWKRAFADTRGVTFVDTFNVGEEMPGGKVKQWTCRRADGAPLAMATIWERWEHPQFGALHVFVPVTTDAPPAIHSKDDRFPVLLDNDDDIALWLGETGAPIPEIKTLIRVYDGEMIFEEEKKDPPSAKAKRNDDQPSLF